jgi:hypothetical protein
MVFGDVGKDDDQPKRTTMIARSLIRTTTWRAVVAIFAACGMLAVGATPTDARWRVHNDGDVTQIIAPRGGTEDQSCADRLRGQSAWSTGVPAGDDPDQYAPPPGDPFAYGALSYDVWKAPAGFTEGNFVEADTGTGVDFYPEGSFDPLPAVFVRQFTTPPRAPVPPEPLYPKELDPEGTNLYLFSLATFSVPLSGVAVGELLGVKPSSAGSTFIDLTAIRCAPTVRIDFVRYNPAGRDTGSNWHLNREIVRISNVGSHERSLAGWRLRDSDGHVYRFPTTRLQPGGSVTVHTGRGSNSAGHRYWGQTRYRWDNDGDRAVLRNRAGALVDACRWGNGPGSINC